MRGMHAHASRDGACLCTVQATLRAVLWRGQGRSKVAEQLSRAQPLWIEPAEERAFLFRNWTLASEYQCRLRSPCDSVYNS